MSRSKRPLLLLACREKAFLAGAAQLAFSGSRATSTIWVCRRCQSHFAVQRSLASWHSGNIRTTDRKIAVKAQTFITRRYVSDDTKHRETSNGENGQAELPSHEDQRRSKITKRFSTIMDNLQANIFFAGQRLNDLTGYSGIEKLKREIEEQEQALRAAQEQLVAAKSEFTSAIQQRSDSQREVNELLQRKNTWSPQDLERFTSLYRNDHANEKAEIEAQQMLNDAERASEEASARLSGKILRRYHEEQIWSDKIRRMSTWGTWGLMGVNVLLFLVFQIGVEPWRRKRLVRGFEEKVIEALETQKQHANKVTGEALAALQATHAAHTTDGMAETSAVEKIADDIDAEDVAAETSVDTEVFKESTEQPTGFEAWLPGLQDYRAKLETSFSEREILVRQVDLTKRLLEGTFVGVMMTSIIATLIRGR